MTMADQPITSSSIQSLLYDIDPNNMHRVINTSEQALKRIILCMNYIN